MSEITINGITIDPIKQNRALRDAGLVAEDASESDHILIQTAEPLTAEQRAELAGIDVEMQEYVSDNTYLAAFPPEDLNRVRALPFVSWADVYSRVFKIPPPLLPRSADTGSVRSLADHEPHPDRRLERVDLLLHPGIEATPGPDRAGCRGSPRGAGRGGGDTGQAADHHLGGPAPRPRENR